MRTRTVGARRNRAELTPLIAPLAGSVKAPAPFLSPRGNAFVSRNTTEALTNDSHKSSSIAAAHPPITDVWSAPVHARFPLDHV